MVSGTEWPGGDPFLQRQNEPSIAVSTRNPLHLLAGANDYRTVDLPVTDVLPSKELVGDAWLGVFKSFDGGQRWQSVLLPGYPQDISVAGVSSVLHGFPTASDAVVRAGTNGMFYYSGIAFSRSSNVGQVFVARFIDLDNKENGDVTLGQDPIRYIGAVQIDKGNAGQFLDKPWLAVDVPRAGAAMCSIPVQQPTPLASRATSAAQATQTVDQTFPAGNVYLAYTVFVGNDNNIRTKLYFTRSTDCGATWSQSSKLSEGLPINQGAVVQVDPRTGYVYVAWRQFASSNSQNAIQIVRSTDGGQSFSKASPIVTLPSFATSNPGAPSFFDQGTTGGSFRVNAFPAMAIADSGADGVPGRVFVAWSQRGTQPHPTSARIMLSSSTDGLTWSPPVAMDNGSINDDYFDPSQQGHSFIRGHQFMPSMTFTEGKLMLLYYDQRLDHTLGFYAPNDPFMPDPKGKFYRESRNQAGGVNGNDPDAEIFTPFLTDYSSASTAINPLLLNRRHTVEVRVAQAAQTLAGNPGPNPAFTFAQISQYKFGIRGDETSGVTPLLQQLQVNPLGLPLFQQGCCPFAGDYIDIAGLSFLPPAAAGGTLGALWKFNTAPLQNSVHIATYTSNQDVRPPADGNWANYTPVGVGVGRTSVFDGTMVPNCVAGQEGMRNQNIYSSRITRGLLLSSPQNTKPLSATLQRAFVLLAQNFTDLDKSFLLTIPTQPAGGKASFLQFPAPPLDDPLTVLNISIAAHSGVARSVFATAADPRAIIRVTAAEISAPGGPIVPGGLSSFVVLNADSSSPSLVNPDGAAATGDIAVVEIYTPNISNPNISNPNISNPNVTNPNITNPNITNPNITNPNISNPNISNPDIADPNITNPNISNPNITNPNISNPNISNPNITNTPVADATYATSNKGNTGAAYTVKLVGTSPTPLQLILSKSYATPTGANCQLFEQSQMILQSNIASQKTFITPNITNDPVANITNPNISNASIFLAPGESALITIRGNVDTATMENIVTGIAPVVAAQAANTNDPTHTPQTTAPLFITTAVLPSASGGQAYTATLQVIGGQAPYSWGLSEGSEGLPPGLTLNSVTGVISGTPTQGGTFDLIVEVQDSGRPQLTARRPLTITVQSVDVEALSVAPRQSTPAPWNVGQNVFIQFDIRNIGGVPMSPATPLVCTLGEATVVSTFLFGLSPGSTASVGLNFIVPGGQGTNPLLRCTVTDPADGNVENNSASTNVAIAESITFTVTNTEDSGAGSLRQAILDANTHAGPDRIVFAIPGAAPHVITPASALPSINDTVLIDATPSGTCSEAAPLVEVDGVSAGLAHGLLVNSVGTVIRGLAITRFTGSEFAGIFIAGGFSNVVQCSYFGLAPDGVTVKGNFDGVRIGGSFNNTIGGTSTAVGNILSGNLRNGVLIMGPTSGEQGSIMQTLVQGNFIGTDATGALDSGNGSNGVQIINSARNTIGGAGAARNVISANTGEGVRIDGAFATENLVQGNYVGTTANGSVDLGNSASGVYIRRAPGNFVTGNVVSGNDGFAGIAICGDLEFCGGGNLGTQGNNASGNVLKGNLIGTNAEGTEALGNSQRGISIDGAPTNVIGGPIAGDGNVIAANGLNGVMIFGSGADGNLVRGNSIGTDAGGTLNLGNSGAGVLIQAGSNNIVSGKDDDRTAPNRIRFNRGAGIAVTGGSGNRLRINRFESNGGLGIDLGDASVTPNDAADEDAGPNGLQNSPVLSAATTIDGVVTVQGSLNSTPNATFTIDLYVSSACHTSGSGVGSQWFGAFTVTTNEAGDAPFNVGFGGNLASVEQTVTALATAGDFVTEFAGEGSTSEFSNCVSASSPIP